MNRSDANRLAKRIFMSYGRQADVDWEETCGFYDEIENEADEELVHYYFMRCIDRVSDWLNS